MRSLIFAISFVAFFTSCNQPQVPEKPNILFIMSDDHAINAIGCYNRRLADFARTKNIDKLASQGMRFDQCFVTNSICSPSRATILTGKYSHKNGVYCLNQNFVEQPTSASILHNAGYQTAVYGKWHLKSKPIGFDDYKVLVEQGRYKDPEFVEKGTDSMTMTKGWVDDVVSDLTMDFIRGRDKNKPFYVLAHFKSAHDPWSTRPPFDTAYQNINITEPDNLCDTYENRSNAAKNTTLKLEMIDQRTFRHKRLETTDTCKQRAYIYQQYIKAYMRSARVIDENVGKLMQFLKEEGLEENTILVYTSDQGHFLGEHGFFSKRFFYDESAQMPLIVRYPGKIKPASVSYDLAVNIDFAPTILDLAGISIPEDMQGKSLKNILYGEHPEDWRTGMYYHYWQHLLHRDVAAHYGIRTKNYKLIYYYGLNLGQTDYPPTDPEWELFDLQKDPSEMNNVYNNPDYQDIIIELKKELLKLKEQYDDKDEKYPELVEVNKKYFFKN